MRLLRCIFSVLTVLTAIPLFASDRIFESFADELPVSARSVIFFDLRKIRVSPLRAVSPGTEGSIGLLSAGEKAFAGQGVDPAFSTGAFFFSGEYAALLLDSSLSPELLTKYSSSEHGEASGIIVTETGTDSGCSIFLLKSPEDDRMKDDVLACSFSPDRTGRLFLSTASRLPSFLRSERGWNSEARACMAHLPAGAALEGILYPDSSVFPGEGSSPLWNGVGRIAFAFSWKEGDPYPFRGNVLFFPRTSEEAGTVRRSLENLVQSAYAAGREKGEIRPEMLFAFQVLPGHGCTELRIQLTGPDADDFVDLFVSQLKKGVFGK